MAKPELRKSTKCALQRGCREQRGRHNRRSHASYAERRVAWKISGRTVVPPVISGASVALADWYTLRNLLRPCSYRRVVPCLQTFSTISLPISFFCRLPCSICIFSLFLSHLSPFPTRHCAVLPIRQTKITCLFSLLKDHSFMLKIVRAVMRAHVLMV